MAGTATVLHTGNADLQLWYSFLLAKAHFTHFNNAAINYFLTLLLLASSLVLVILFFQTLPLQSIMHELDVCFILGKSTVWRGITAM